MCEKNKLVFILLLAAFFRLFGLNWDQGAHLHPDERFLTMVATNLKWPTSFSQYLNPTTSPLNPANTGYSFFVYGTFPLFLVKTLAAIFRLDDYNNLTLLGRAVSALFDLWTVYLVYLITSNIVISKYRNIASFLASFFYASSVLPIQLSHFFAVDTFLVFFLTLSFYLLMKSLAQEKMPKQPLKGAFPRTLSPCPVPRRSLWFGVEPRTAIPLGIAFGLALASKVSALLFLPIILLGLLVKSFQQTLIFLQKESKKENLKRENDKLTLKSFKFLIVLFTFYFLLFTLGAYISMRLTNPYAFSTGNLFNPSLNPQFLNNLKTLKSFEGANTSFPPAIQWLTSEPLLFPLRNILYYGLGIPLGILAVLGFIYALFYLLRYLLSALKKANNYKKDHNQVAIAYQIWPSFYGLFPLLLITLWVGGLFFYQGTQFVKAMRYFAPIYPFLTILAAFFITSLISKLENFKFLTVIFNFSLLIFNLIWPLSFIAIYARPHSRLQASQWIYKNIPAGSILTCEHWDDCLPLSLSQPPRAGPFEAKSYQTLQLPLYDPDTPEKWEKISQTLKEADYIILSSNRLFGSIPSVPERYPLTTQFYAFLFAEKLGFKKVAEFTSRPHLPFPFLKVCLTFPGESYGYLARKAGPCEARYKTVPGEANSGFTIVDDSADESFTVYDHPRVIIFQKTK